VFERFTEQARQLVILSQEEARSFNHNYIGTEHLLLGLLSHGKGFGAKALHASAVTLDAARRQLDEIIGRGSQTPTGHIPFTPRAKRVLELSLREALELGENEIRTEHILLGLIREGEGVACHILVRLGCDLNEIRRQVFQARSSDSTQAERETPHQLSSTGPDPEATEHAQSAGQVEGSRSGGPSMFARFTDRARRVVVLAQEEARLLNHTYIGTEHILLGLIHEGEGVAAKALESLGISLEAVRRQVEEIIGQGQQAPSGHIPFTPRAKKVLELSLREALQLGHNYIGTEHILLGLIREGEGVATQVLVRLGADLNRARQQVIQLLHGYSGTSQAESTTTAGKPAKPASARHGKALSEVVQLAAAESVALGHGYIGSEHLLIALLLVEHQGPGIRDLLDDSVTADTVRELVVNITEKTSSAADENPVTHEAADAIDLAEFEAIGFGDDEVAPCHLIVPLAAADGSVARQVLRELGVPDRAADLSKDSVATAAWGQRLGVLTALARDAVADEALPGHE
jgi:ATP-dependent Clp protease ATP-binding subunit ClpA